MSSLFFLWRDEFAPGDLHRLSFRYVDLDASAFSWRVSCSPRHKTTVENKLLLLFFLKFTEEYWWVGRAGGSHTTQVGERHGNGAYVPAFLFLFPTSLTNSERRWPSRRHQLRPAASCTVAVPTTSPPCDKYCSLLPSEARRCQDIAFSTRRTSVSRPFEPACSRDESLAAGAEFSLIAASLMAGEDCRGGDDFWLPLFPPPR